MSWGEPPYYLTPRQAEVLAFVRGHQATHGYAPGLRDLARHFGFRSVSGAVCHLRALRAKGLVTWEPGRARTLRAST